VFHESSLTRMIVEHRNLHTSSYKPHSVFLSTHVCFQGLIDIVRLKIKHSCSELWVVSMQCSIRSHGMPKRTSV
jgi:hypothetical protein